MARGRKQTWAKVIKDGNGKPVIGLDENDEPVWWSMDLGQAIAGCHCRHGEMQTTEFLSCFYGCTRQRVDQIEKKAIRVFRIRAQKVPGLWEELRHFLEHKSQLERTNGNGWKYGYGHFTKKI